MKIYTELPRKNLMNRDKHVCWSVDDYESQRKSYDEKRFLNYENYIRVGRELFKEKIILGEKIRDYLVQNNIQGDIFCVGVGDAYTEMQLLEGNRKLLLTDYDKSTIDRYKRLFKDDRRTRFEYFDLKKDDFTGIPHEYPILVANAVFYAFSDRELDGIIGGIKSAGFRELIIVSHTHMATKNMIKRVLKYIRIYLNRFKKNTRFYGYFRETGHYKKILKKRGLSVLDSKELKVNGVPILYRVRISE
jgi:hypothetical protein